MYITILSVFIQFSIEGRLKIYCHLKIKVINKELY